MKQFILLIIVSLFSMFPLFHQGFFITDDADWMIVRFSAFHQTLRDGEVPPRFLGRLNHEYGYPVATFLYPGFMYLAEPLHLIGFGFVDSIKILLGLALILSGVFTYFWLRKFFDTTSSLVGSLFYLYTPYHLFDLYQRGSVGELLALAILPFILWQVEKKSVFWSSIGLGFLLLSHNILGAVFLIFLICYCVLDIAISKKKKEQSMLYGKIFIFGFGLSAFFWIPALFELRYTVFSETTISNWREYFAPVSLIGYATIAVLLLTIFHFVTKTITLKKHRLTALLFVIGLVSLFFATSFSAVLWEVLPVQFIQFPYRLLSVLLISLAFLAAMTLSVFQGKKKIFLGVVLVSVLLFSAYPFARPTTYVDKGDDYYATNMDTTTVHDEYMPVWVKEKPSGRPETKVAIIQGEGEITNIVINNKQISFILTGNEKTTVQINTIYWPGWEAGIDGKKTEIMYTNPKGVMQLSIPEGRHDVRVLFTETPLRLGSDIISLASFVLLIGIEIRKRRKG